MPKFWIAIFFIVLAAAQLYQSIKDIDLPFPVYLVLGTVLAVAANAQHKFAFFPTEQFTSQEKPSDPVLTAQAAPILTAAESKNPPVQLDAAIEPKKTKPRTRKAATDKALAPEAEIKKPRTRKATPKSQQAS
jgi:hypothetical protein